MVASTNSNPSEVLAELRRMVDKNQIDREALYPLIFAMQVDLMAELQDLKQKIAPLQEIQKNIQDLKEHDHDEKYAAKVSLEATTEKIKKLDDEITAWKNRAIGIGIGAAISGAGIGALIARIISAIP